MGESKTAAGGSTGAAVGAARLGIDAVCGLTGVVESMHATIARAPLPLGPAPVERTRGVSRVVYQTIRGVTRLVGSGLDRALPLLAPALEQASGSPPRVLAALNGVIGHHLEASGNPLAIRMAITSCGQPLDLSASADRLAGPPSPASKLLVMVHGLCMSELGWSRQGHDHGEALAADLGYQPLYVRYNSGRHISTNGRELARCMEELVDRWPAPIDELVIIGHSMGGLVARSACHHARASGQRWIDRLDRLVFVGTPHHGAALERAGNLFDLLLEVSPYAAPLVRIGGNRSAGINDLRFGNLLDEDWEGRPPRYRRDPRTPVPLPARVECHAIAGAMGRRAGLAEGLAGDGMVSVASALGRHRDPRFDLALPASHVFVARETSHLALLSSQVVHRRIRDWLEAPPG
jgi:pimeloyl-ACP methyl ester carboxylesterase